MKAGPKSSSQVRRREHPGAETRRPATANSGEASGVDSGSLAGRNALITGADTAIGRAVALAFAREGADALLAYSDAETDTQETARLIAAMGRKAVIVCGDISREERCQALVHQAVAELGGLDILVNNAFQIARGDGAAFPSREFDATFRRNFYAMFSLCKASVPQMASGSAIINAISMEAYRPDPELRAYATTKAAIVNFTRALAQSVTPEGIRVNAVASGPVWMPQRASSAPGETNETFGMLSPIRRPAQPEELARVYVLLASSEAGYGSGGVYGVAGGTPLF